MTEQENTFWSDHLPTALMTLRFTAHRVLGMPPYIIVTGRSAMPPSHLLEEVDLEEIDPAISAKDRDRYVGWVCARTTQL